MRTESPSYFLRLGVIVAAGLLLIFFQQGGLALPLRESIFWTLKPGLRSARLLGDAGRAVSAGAQFWWTGTQRLATAEHELAKQRIEGEKVRELEKENQLLRQELGRKRSGYAVLRFFGGGTQWFVDGGCRQGIEKGSPVLFEESLVGRILEVNTNFSAVESIVDPNFRLPVNIGSASATGLLESSRGVVEVTHVSARDGIGVGDNIRSGGLEKIPPDLAVGRVISVENNEATGLTSALVEPYFHLNSIDFVAVPIEKEAACP